MAFSQGRALLVGIAHYQDREWQVDPPVTVADAQALGEALQDPAVSGYPPDRVQTLADATLAEVKTALQTLAGQTQSSDTVVLFFNAHGVLGDDGQYYFTTRDTVFNPNQTVRAGTGLSGPDFIEALHQIKPRKMLVLLNTCHSGNVRSLGQETALGSSTSTTLNTQILASGEGRALITACKPQQLSYYGDGPHTFFGQALLDTLHGQGVPDRDGYIGLFELYQAVYDQVVKARQGKPGKQEPVITVLEAAGAFPVAFFPGSSQRALGVPSIQQTLPAGPGVQVVPKSTVQSLLDFGQNNQMQNLRFGDIAGGNITKIDTGGGAFIGGSVNLSGGTFIGRDQIITITSAATAAKTSDAPALLALIQSLQTSAGQLSDVDPDDRDDLVDNLEKAQQAAQAGKRERLLDKLNSAEQLALKLGTPAAIQLANSIGAALQRANTLQL